MSFVGLAAAILLLVVLPGWLLVNAAFPSKRTQALGWIERVYLTIASGTFLLILDGVVLGLLPHARYGFFETLSTGAPHVELAMLAVSALLFYVGLVRGAYPRIAARFPRLVAPDGQTVS
jgi:hypothetical protein